MRQNFVLEGNNAPGVKIQCLEYENLGQLLLLPQPSYIDLIAGV